MVGFCEGKPHRSKWMLQIGVPPPLKESPKSSISRGDFLEAMFDDTRGYISILTSFFANQFFVHTHSPSMKPTFWCKRLH